MVCRFLLLNKNTPHSLIFYFGPFLAKKQPKLTKNEENLENPNYLVKFSEIWNVDVPQQKKMLQKIVFRFQHFLAKKQEKFTKTEVYINKIQTGL